MVNSIHNKYIISISIEYVLINIYIYHVNLSSSFESPMLCPIFIQKWFDLISWD